MDAALTERRTAHATWEDAIARCLLTGGPLPNEYVVHNIVWEPHHQMCFYSEVKSDFAERLARLKNTTDDLKDDDVIVWFLVHQTF